MTSQSAIDLKFGDGEYTFALPLGRIKELEAKCGAPGPPVGIGTIFSRVFKSYALNEKREIVFVAGASEFHAIDLVETIRQGLIGGGKGVIDNGEEIVVTPQIAERLLKAYVYDRPLQEAWSIAVSILGACIIGFDAPKKG